MPIAFDAFSGGSVGSSSLTVSHTVGSLTNGYLVVSVSVNGSATDVLTSVTYNGATMTRLKAAQVGSLTLWTYIYGIANPPAGAHNVVATCSSSQIIRMANGSYSDVKQSGQPDASANGSATPGTSVTAAVTVVDTNCWLISAVQNDGGLVETAGGALTTSRGTDGNNILTLGDSNGSVSPGSRNATWTSGSQNQGAVAISLLAIESGAPVSGGFFLAAQ